MNRQTTNTNAYEKILYTGNRSYQCEYCCARNDGALCMALPECIDVDGEWFVEVEAKTASASL